MAAAERDPDPDPDPDPAPLNGPVVVDANVLFAALIADGTTRHLLLHAGLDLRSPATIWDEFDRNRGELVAKSRTTEAAFDLLVDLLRDRIADVPLAAVRPHLDDAVDALGPAHRLDAPYVACAMAVGGTLWSQDKALGERAPVPVVATAEVVERVGMA